VVADVVDVNVVEADDFVVVVVVDDDGDAGGGPGATVPAEEEEEDIMVIENFVTRKSNVFFGIIVLCVT